MKKIIAMLLMAAMLVGMAGCAPSEPENLMADVQGGNFEPAQNSPEGNVAAADFALRLFQTGLEDEKNTLVSPLSVLCALSMTANGAKGETLAQMEAVLGMDVESLNRWVSAYMAALPEREESSMHLANSIWFRDTPSLQVEESFLKTNADYYSAGIYKAPFDQATCDQINDWVKDHTDGMIPTVLDEIPEETVMYLVNALAFDAKWAAPYNEFQVREAQFHLTDAEGTSRTVEMMYSEEYAYLEDGQATGFIKYYYSADYAFVALLPNENVDLGDYARSLTAQKLLAMLENPQSVDVDAGLPKFETEYSVEMNDILKSMGMEDAFDGRVADLTGIGTSSDGNLFISRVLHKTFISVAEQGTRAGAATVVAVDTQGAIIDPPERKTVILDRPFLYMLVDCRSNLPFFIGTVVDIGD